MFRFVLAFSWVISLNIGHTHTCTCAHSIDIFIFWVIKIEISKCYTDTHSIEPSDAWPLRLEKHCFIRILQSSEPFLNSLFFLFTKNGMRMSIRIAIDCRFLWFVNIYAAIGCFFQLFASMCLFINNNIVPIWIPVD